MRETPRLESARLVLRPDKPEDADALHPTMADERLMTWWSRAPHATIEDTRADLAHPSDDWRRWMITMKGDDTAIGFVAMGEKRQGRVSEVGYLLARAHWGRGIAREAVERVIDHVFLTENQRRIFADTDPDNRASRALLERMGFVLEGTLRGEWETHIGVRDSVIYGLLKEEWTARRG